MGQMPLYNELISNKSITKGGLIYEFIECILYDYVVHPETPFVYNITHINCR